MIRFDPDDGGILLLADPDDARALLDLASQFEELLADPTEPGSAPSDPALIRLFPDPVPGDPESAAEARRLIVPALRTHKRGNAERVAASLREPGPLEPADELAWLQWLTDIRLVLAARLGIVIDGDEGRSGTEAERAMQWTYQVLGALQGRLLDLLDERLDAAGIDGRPA